MSMTLTELYAEAAKDLSARNPNARLEWAMRHAKAHGRLVAFERRLKRAEMIEADVAGRLSSSIPFDDETRLRLMGLMPAPQEMEAMREMHADAAAWVRFTELVLEMLTKGTNR